MDRISRRDFLRVSTAVAAATVAAACAGPAATPTPTTAPAEPTAVPPTTAPEVPTAAEAPTEAPTAAPAARYQEAPMLAELVAKGELPPVEERLPESPTITPVVHALGNYGGSWRRGFKGVSDRWGPVALVSRRLTIYTPEMTIRPELCESWELSSDAKTWTIHMRKGGKFSDSTSFDASRVRWWWENHELNTDITPTVHDQWKSGSGNDVQVMELETPDEWTVILRYANPKPLLQYDLTSAEPWEPEYMEQYHIDFAPDKEALKKEALEAGFDSWSSYYADREMWYMNPERPVVGVWKPVNALSEEMFVMERNPYCFDVDEEGNQLPYIDRITHRLFSTPDVFNLWIINGEIDKQARHVDMANFTLYKENEAKGDYKVLEARGRGAVGLNTNHTAKDPNLREFFQTKEVRLALSYAVDRDELNELVFDGTMTPMNCGPVESSPQFREDLFKAYTEYDPELANQLLDEAGYHQRDAEGFRLWKDGSGRAGFIIESLYEPGSQYEDAVQVVIKYLRDVGLDVQYKYLERSLFEERYRANDIACGFWGMDRNEMVIIMPQEYLGTMIDRPWAGAWGIWKNDPTNPNGEAPPEGHWIWDIWNIWDQVAVEPDEKKQTELFDGILDIWLEQLPQVCYLGQGPVIAICKNGFRNYELRGENYMRTNSATYFWEDPENHA